MLRPLALLLATCAAACGASSASVPVKGAETDVAMLAGKWEGSYEGTDSGRRGSIHFDLTLGHHTAEGHVLMGAGAGAGAGGAATPVPLQIKFVAVAGGGVSGKIAPYTDPGCSCTVETEFTGRVDGESMAGTFVTTGASLPAPQSGTWTAQRR